MRRILWIGLVLAGSLAASGPLPAQTPSGNPPPADQAKPGEEGKKPAPAPSANPFPEDTSTVPVMPSRTEPATSEVIHNGAENVTASLPGDDLDPVRSPDDPTPDNSAGQPDESSSSLAGLGNLLPRPDEEQPGKKKKHAVEEPAHHETASEDIEVGGYYLETKNWKAALSRFESALVLAPENPEVYWGLAEASRHLGNFADARANYEKVAEYDPDSRHGKEARKALKEPQIANGKNAAVSQTPSIEAHQ